MTIIEFEELKKQFQKADIDTKVTLYVDTDGLTKEQYLELLRMFPVDQIGKLEAALQ